MNAFSRTESHRLSAQRGGAAASHTGMYGALVIDRRYNNQTDPLPKIVAGGLVLLR